MTRLHSIKVLIEIGIEKNPDSYFIAVQFIGIFRSYSEQANNFKRVQNRGCMKMSVHLLRIRSYIVYYNEKLHS